MKHLVSCFVGAFMCFTLPGCVIPNEQVQSATATQLRMDGTAIEERELTPEQVFRLSAWLNDRRWGWRPLTTSAPPLLTITVRYPSGKSLELDLADSKLLLEKQQRTLSRDELLALHIILDPNKSRPSHKHS